MPLTLSCAPCRLLVIFFVLMVVVGCANRILSVLQYVPMANYPLLVNLVVTAAYLPTSLLWVVPATRLWGMRMEEPPPGKSYVPQRAWAVMGLLDSIAGVLQALAVDFVSNGTLVTLLLQSAIPISMILSRLILKQKYKNFQYAGAVIVVVGLLIVLGPAISGGLGGGANVALWGGVLIASCIPMTLSSVYKELYLGDVETDPIWFNLMVAVYQLLFSFPLLVPSALTSGIAVSDIGANLVGGVKCLAGINTLASDNCAQAGAYTAAYIAANVGFNILIILLLKYGGSNILWLSLTFNVPVSALAFAVPGIPGYQPLNWTVGLGLPVIMTGLIVYRFYTPFAAWLRKLAGYTPLGSADVEAS